MHLPQGPALAKRYVREQTLARGERAQEQRRVLDLPSRPDDRSRGANRGSCWSLPGASQRRLAIQLQQQQRRSGGRAPAKPDERPSCWPGAQRRIQNRRSYDPPITINLARQPVPCPQTLTFQGIIKVSGSGTVKYQWTIGDKTRGPYALSFPHGGARNVKPLVVEEDGTRGEHIEEHVTLVATEPELKTWDGKVDLTCQSSRGRRHGALSGLIVRLINVISNCLFG